MIFLNLFTGFHKDQAALVDVGNVIRDLVEIAGDVGRHQHRMILFFGKRADHGQNVIADDRIQTAGCLIEDQQPRIMTEGDRKFQLHLHSA